jgi:hypothetical protein
MLISGGGIFSKIKTAIALNTSWMNGAAKIRSARVEPAAVTLRQFSE